jgi:hypothetical protein
MQIRILFFIILCQLLITCSRQEPPSPCLLDDCRQSFWIDTLSNAATFKDGYWRVKYQGLGYFTIKGQLSELKPEYVINKIPLIETQYDSDYWIIFDTLSFTVPMYSYMGWFNDKKFNTPISIGNKTYTMSQWKSQSDIYNLAGYTITRHMCIDCPYTPTLIGSYSKYNYTPSKSFYLSPQMIGDTATIFIRVLYNNDYGNRVVREEQMKLIFE